MLYYISVRRMVVTVSQEQILYPTWPERKIKWTELSNLVLKDSLLTIDFKTDKIIQQMIDEKRTSINETEFNEFCRQQLNK